MRTYNEISLGLGYALFAASHISQHPTPKTTTTTAQLDRHRFRRD